MEDNRLPKQVREKRNNGKREGQSDQWRDLEWGLEASALTIRESMDSEKMGSNPTQSMDVHLHFFYVCDVLFMQTLQSVDPSSMEPYQTWTTLACRISGGGGQDSESNRQAGMHADGRAVGQMET